MKKVVKDVEFLSEVELVKGFDLGASAYADDSSSTSGTNTSVLAAHEATHVTQQGTGTSSGQQQSGGASSSSSSSSSSSDKDADTSVDSD